MKALFIFCLLVGFTSLSAQNYVRLFDATGVEPTEEEDLLLDAAVIESVSILPNNLQTSFKVFDTGFYLHSENMAGGIDAVWEKVKDDVASDSGNSFYLIFGRENNIDGANSKIRVELKLPSTTLFECLTEEKRNNVEKYVQAVANQNISSSVYEGEIKALDMLGAYIYKIVECECTGIRTSCALSAEYKFIDPELLGLGFRKKEIQIGESCTWTNGNQGIYDYFGKQVIFDGIPHCIPEEVSEGKTLIESSAELDGDVYILDNQSFTNGEWETAKSSANTKSYVEYWIIVFDSDSNKIYLYTTYTFGTLDNPALRDNHYVGNRSGSVIPTWGDALKILGTSAINACFQASANYIFTDDDWSQAFSHICYSCVLWEGTSDKIMSYIPFLNKYNETEKLLIAAATSAVANVSEKYIRNKSTYTVETAISDFIHGLGTSMFTQYLAPKIGHFGVKAFTKGMTKMDKYFTNGTIKTIIKETYNTVIKGLGKAIDLSVLKTKFTQIIGDRGLLHIFRGEIKNGIASGVHHISAIRFGAARIIPGSIKNLGKGFYKAKVEVLHGTEWILKTDESTFFPDDWNEEMVLDEIYKIIKRKPKANSGTGNPFVYIEKMSNEIKVRFTTYSEYSNNIYTAYPIL